MVADGTHSSGKLGSNVRALTPIKVANPNRRRTLAPYMAQLAAFNRQFLELLRHDGDSDVSAELLRLSPNELDAIASHSVSLFSIGLHDAILWEQILSKAKKESSIDHIDTRYDNFVRAVVFFAWYLSQQDVIAARVLLGVHSYVLDALRQVSLPDVQSIAMRAARYVAPRWLSNDQFWSLLVTSAKCDDKITQRDMELLAHQLLALTAMPARKLRVEQRSKSWSSKTHRGPACQSASSRIGYGKFESPESLIAIPL